MKITPEITQKIRSYAAWLKETKGLQYEWEPWLTIALKHEVYPNCCSLLFELQGHTVIDMLLMDIGENQLVDNMPVINQEETNKLYKQ